jgi:hypothetical protein
LAYSLPNLKLLKAIGAVSSSEGKKAASRAGNYQDAATASLDRDLDNDATTQDDSEGDQGNQAVSGDSGRAVVPDRSGSILSSVDKVLSY